MATNYTESSLATLYHNRTIPIPKNLKARFPENIKLNNKIRIYQGDICELPVDAIVNAANKSLLGGGGIDGAIHKAAGPQLKAECKKLNGAETGEAKITKAYGRLACKHVIHTVGPVYLAAKDKKIRNRTKLISCYYESFERAKENKCKSIAFCCISTGVYSYPNEDAAHVALTTVRKYLEELNKDDKIEEVVFCLFLDKDVEIYKRLVP